VLNAGQPPVEVGDLHRLQELVPDAAYGVGHRGRYLVPLEAVERLGDDPLDVAGRLDLTGLLEQASALATPPVLDSAVGRTYSTGQSGCYVALDAVTGEARRHPGPACVR